jgi:hypothetical protein
MVSLQGPLTSKEKDLKGSLWNVMIEWMSWEVKTKPLPTMAAYDPINCALYAKENTLLGNDGENSLSLLQNLKWYY